MISRCQASLKRQSIPRPLTMACEKSDGALSFLHSELFVDLAKCQYAEREQNEQEVWTDQ